MEAETFPESEGRFPRSSMNRMMAALGALGAMRQPVQPAAGTAAEGEDAADAASKESIVEALKQALVDKCSSLDHAFCWLDFNSRGHFSRSQFDTGLRVLNLEGPLKSLKPTKIFSMIDTKHSGSVGIQEWRDFFGYDADDEEAMGGGSSDRAVSRFTGARGASVLQKVKNLASFLRSSKREGAAADDSEIQSKTGSLPELDTILALADDAMPSSASLGEADTTMKRLGGVSRKKAAGLVATDMHRAEALQIEKDLAALNYKGVHALAYILAAKCGSVDKAFQWLDYNSTGSFTLMQWETAVMVMHVSVEALTGMKPRDLYLKMGGKKGRVTKKQWERFFSGEMDAESWNSIKDMQSSFRNRSRKVFKGLMVFRKSSTTAQSRRSSTQPVAPARRDSQGADNTSTKRSSLKAVAAAAMAAGWNQPAPATPPSGSPPPPSADEPAAEGPAATDDEAVRPSAGAKKFRRASAGARRASAADAAPASARGGGGKIGKSRTSVELQEAQALDAFRRRVRQELLALKPDEGWECRELSEAPGHHQVVREAAAELGLRLLSLDGSSAAVFREGPESSKMKQQLQVLRPGERATFSGTAFQLQFVRQVAEAFKLHARRSASAGAESGEEEAAESLEVFHLGGSLEDFLEGAREQLRSLRPGESVNFPSQLSDEKREALRKLAAELGLVCAGAEDPDGEGSQLCIGNLSNLADDLRAKLGAIAPGESQEISSLMDGCPASQLPLARELLNKVAEEEGLVVEATSVSRPDRGESSSEDEEYEYEEEEEEYQGTLDLAVLDEATVKERVAELFGRYATGKAGRTNVFLRKPDVTRFIGDALAAEGKRLSERVVEWIEREYDETLELQVDMGSKYHYGIVLEFFQVFLSKAADVLERSLVGLLSELLHWYASPKKDRKKKKRRGSKRASVA